MYNKTIAREQQNKINPLQGVNKMVEMLIYLMTLASVGSVAVLEIIKQIKGKGDNDKHDKR